MKQYRMECQIRKAGSKAWETTYTSEDKEHVLEMLACDLAAKYLGHAPYVKSIKRKQNYDGTATYTVVHTLSEDQDQRTLYTAPIYA